MFLALASLAALLIVIVVSRNERINVGILAIAMAWALGFYWAKMPIHDIVHAFPTSLFIILFGVTFFFSLVKANGTLDHITHWAIRCARGKTALLPVIFFILPLVFAMFGVGNIGAIALFAPLAMTVAGKVGISAFFMTIMLVNGANAGTLSPFSPTGIIAGQLVAQQGLVMEPWRQLFLPSFLAQSFVAFSCYAILIRRMHQKEAEFDFHKIVKSGGPFTRPQIFTLMAVICLIVGVMVFKADIGFLALALAAVLMLANISDGETAVKAVPWNIIMMVCGVSTLIGVMGKTGGLGLFTDLLAKAANPVNVTGLIAFVTGIISTYSSSSGVVMPAFIPIVPELIAKIGGGYPAAIVASINVGSHVVDISPLSTLGAICLGSAGVHENKSQLFQKLLMYGLMMSLYGALVSFIFFGLLGPWFLAG